MYLYYQGFLDANLAPLAWKGLVVDCTSVGHDSAASRTWCIDTTGAEPKLLWQTPDFVPFNEMQRSNMLIRDGRLYGFDARGPWQGTSNAMALSGRAKRPASEKPFQCCDMATGKLLWSTDVIGGGEWSNSRMVAVGDRLDVASKCGISVCWLRDDGLVLLESLTVADTKFPVPVMSDPVVVDGRLFVRQLYLLDRGGSRSIAATAGVQGTLLAINRPSGDLGHKSTIRPVKGELDQL